MAQRREGTRSGFCGGSTCRPNSSFYGHSAAEPGFSPQAFLLSVLSLGLLQGPLLLGPVAKPALSLAGIPTLIVLDPQGEVITRQGRVEVLNDEDCREFPWHPKPVLELSDSNAVQLNEGPCLVLFVGMKHMSLAEWAGSGWAGQDRTLGGMSVPTASFRHRTMQSLGLCLSQQPCF